MPGMTSKDWQRLLSIAPEELTEEEKDDLFNSVAWYVFEPGLDEDRMKCIFSVAQEILKYKGDQVESLVVELDELAARQGAEEAQRNRKLIEEVEDLRLQLKSSQRRGSKHSTRSGIDNADLRQELVQCETNNEKLLAELKSRERDALLERKESEKLAAQVASLEREKTELRRELAAVQNETSSHQESFDSPERLSAEKQRELTDSVHQKNRHISQLLNDVETVENENVVLREKLSHLCEELSEATKHLTQMTGELTSLKLTCNEQEQKMNLVEEQNIALRTQVAELVEQKLLRDAQLDNFSEALDSRVLDWKKLTEKKDAEIEELNAKMAHLAAQAPNIQIDTDRSHVAMLMQTLQTREEQIADLQAQLAEATKELNVSASIIEQIKSKKSRHKTAEVNVKLKAQLQLAENQLKLYENKIKDAEEDTCVKAKEMTDMIIQLRQYESGEYGLYEAVGEIKELRKQLNVRDKHIAALVQSANRLQAEAGLFEEQNIALREKLGLPADSQISVDGVHSKRQKQQALMHLRQHQAERLEEEKLQLRLINRKLTQHVARLIRQVTSLGCEPTDSSSQEEDGNGTTVKKIAEGTGLITNIKHADNLNREIEEQLEFYKIRVDELTKENDALRKGMHEILDSIHNQDGSSSVHLESQCLERLLEALDSRHVSGWYHPAMRLQGQLQALEGSNTILREQLRESRSQESETSQKLQKATVKIEEMEKTLASPRSVSGSERFVQNVHFLEEQSIVFDASIPGMVNTNTPNNRLALLQQEYNNAVEQNKIKEKSLEEGNKILADTKYQVKLLEERYASEKTVWQSDKESLEAKVESIEAKLTEFNGHWDVLDQGPDEQKRFLSESAKRLASAKSNEVVAVRKCKSLQDKENQLLKEKTQLSELVSSLQCTITQKSGELKRSKEMFTFQISSLQKALNESVPITMLETANKDLNDITLKYRDLLQTEQSSATDSQLAKRLEEEKEILQNDKTELATSLQLAREKLHSLEALVMSLNQDTVTQDNHDNQISTLTKKLATLEMKELNERQRADHADKIYLIMKGQLQQLEGRNEEIASQSKTLILQNLELQQVERNLRDSLLSYVSRDELQLVEAKLQASEANQMEMKMERESVREMLDIAQEQVRTLELWKTTRDCEIDSLKQTVLQLQSSSDEKMVIARANQDTLSARVMEAEATKKAQNLQIETLKLQAANIHLEAKLEENEKDFVILQSNLISRLKVLHQAIQSLRQQYIGSVPLTKLEIFYESMQCLKDERKRVWVALREAETKEHETDTLKEFLQSQLQSIDQLKMMLNSKSLQVVDWHSQVTDLKLKEIQARKKVEFYEIQLQQAEERFQKQEKYIAILERESVFDGRNNFEEFALGLESRRSSESYQPVVVEANKPAVLTLADGDGIQITNTNDAEFSALKMQLASLVKQVEQRDNLLMAKDKAITEIMSSVAKLPKQKEIVVDKKVLEPAEKLALKTSLASLESIVSQKEETITRLQNLIKESRDEHSRAAAQAQEELLSVQTALANQTQAHNKLKDRLRQSNYESKPSLSTIEQYITRMHELEDEVAELNTAVGNLSNQLHACRGEADRWRALADDRLNNMGELRKRLEEQHRAELESYKAETKRHKVELESSQQELNEIQVGFKRHMEQTAKGPASAVPVLRAQLAKKDQEISALSKTLAELRLELAEKSGIGQRAAQAKAAEEIQSLKIRLNTLNEELALAKEDSHKQSVKLREFSLKKKEESRSEREEILLKKLKYMEDNFREERTKLERETSETILKRIKTAEEVARWEEKKRNQQTIEKLKEKLAERMKEEEKLLRTDKALRETISRLDREKIALTNRSSRGTGKMESRFEALDLERAKLAIEVASLKNKLESQKRHSGGLGAAILEEKLEAQQRRIAILELGKKGVNAVSDELEKLQGANSVLQKANLRLESENLELRLDFEKNRSETPHLKEKVTHLEKYIALMKAENSSNTPTSSDGDNFSKASENKSNSELEKTVLTLKRVVEKLQIENTNLREMSNNKKSNDRATEDRLKEDLQTLEAEKKQLQEHYLMAMEHTTVTEDKLDKYEFKIKSLETKLSSLTTECEVLKTQLVQKTQLLDRVKGLLQRAALKEKHLNEQVVSLQRLVPPASLQSFGLSSNAELRY